MKTEPPLPPDGGKPIDYAAEAAAFRAARDAAGEQLVAMLRDVETASPGWRFPSVELHRFDGEVFGSAHTLKFARNAVALEEFEAKKRHVNPTICEVLQRVERDSRLRFATGRFELERDAEGRIVRLRLQEAAELADPYLDDEQFLRHLVLFTNAVAAREFSVTDVKGKFSGDGRSRRIEWTEERDGASLSFDASIDWSGKFEIDVRVSFGGEDGSECMTIFEAEDYRFVTFDEIRDRAERFRRNVDQRVARNRRT